MGVGCRVGVGGQEVEDVVEGEENGYDEGLGYFNAIDACEDIYAVWAEDCNSGHVHVVEGTQVEEFAEVRLQRDRHDDGSDAKVDEVDDEQRDGGECRDEELVAPTDVEDVVSYSENGDGLEGHYGG